MTERAWCVVRGASWTLIFLLALSFIAAAPQRLSAQAKLEDNSFLAEEAYNQDPRVVQHISTAELHHGETLYSFTQEWPVHGQKRQLSYTLTAAQDAGFTMGDGLVNFRYQAVGKGEDRVWIAPRLSAIVPVGDANKNGGNGGWGLDGVVPLSWEAAERLTVNLDLGGTWRPSAQNALGAKAGTLEPYMAASTIFFVTKMFNLLAETTWRGSETVVSSGHASRTSDHALLLGARLGFNLPGKLQLVPGAAWMPAIDQTPTRAFLYFSAEHPF